MKKLNSKFLDFGAKFLIQVVASTILIEALTKAFVMSVHDSDGFAGFYLFVIVPLLAGLSPWYIGKLNHIKGHPIAAVVGGLVGFVLIFPLIIYTPWYLSGVLPALFATLFNDFDEILDLI